jgi:hypothetical protein
LDAPAKSRPVNVTVFHRLKAFAGCRDRCLKTTTTWLDTFNEMPSSGEKSNVSLCFERPSAHLASPDKSVIATSSVPTDIPPNHVLIKVDRFGFSANNVTYQALGEQPHFRFAVLDDFPFSEY